MLIKEASQFYKMFSNWVFVLIAVLTVVQSEWGEVWSKVIPDGAHPYIIAALSLLGVVSRLINQGIKPR